MPEPIKPDPTTPMCSILSAMTSHRSGAAPVALATAGRFQPWQDGAHPLACTPDAAVELLDDLDGTTQTHLEHVYVDDSPIELDDDAVELGSGF
jgi:hypothetical protein